MPLYETASVPLVVTGEPDTERNAGTERPTDVTLPLPEQAPFAAVQTVEPFTVAEVDTDKVPLNVTAEPLWDMTEEVSPDELDHNGI